jgi:hypothetical protein
MTNKRVPITRVNKFFGQEDFDFHINIGQEYLHGDLNMTLVLYRVDSDLTDIDNVYGEVGENQIKFYPPIEFKALVKIEDTKNNSYNGGMVRNLEPGNLTLSVYLKHLNDLNIDIKYGDYIGYPETEDKIRFYTVINDGKIVVDNKHTLFGYKPYYRTITCAIAQNQEFNGI